MVPLWPLGVTSLWSTRPHALWSRFLFFLLLIIEGSPPPARGACPLGPVLWPWVKAPTLFGKQGLRSYLLIMWLTISHVEAYPTWLVRRGSEDVWSPHFDRIVKYFFRLPGKYSASWYQQCGRQLGEETLPVVLEIASHLGSLFVFHKWVIHGICFLFGPVFRLEIGFVPLQ